MEPHLEFVAVSLSGPLARLPTEILLDILSHCDPKSVVNFLGSCKALQQLASQNENRVFRDLYHSTFALLRLRFHHPLCSPAQNPTAKKGKVVRYPANKLLPFAAVYSWKLQWRDLVHWNTQDSAWSRSTWTPGLGVVHWDADVSAWPTSSWEDRMETEVCMECGVKRKDARLETICAWELRLCLLCFTKNLVPKRNLSMFGLTARDIVGLQTVKLNTKIFYSARQLASLAREKPADFEGPRLLAKDKKNASQVRDDLVSTATLLHGGVSWKGCLSLSIYNTGNTGIGEDFEPEFDHFIKAKSFKKGHRCKKRPIADILADYATFVKERKGISPATGIPYFHPAASPGPATPSDACIDAYAALREAATKEELALFPSTGNPEAVAQMIKAMQDYVLDPDSHNLAEIVEDLRRFKAVKAVEGTKESKDSMDLPDWTGSVAVDLVAAVSVEGESQPTAEQWKRLHVLSQVGAILGTPFTTLEAQQLLLPPAQRVAERSRVVGYYEWATTREILEETYTGSMLERRTALTRAGQRALAASGTFMSDLFIQKSLEASLLCSDYDVFTSDQLSRNDYEEEIRRLMSLIDAGIFSQATLCVFLSKFGSCCCGGYSSACQNGE